MNQRQTARQRSTSRIQAAMARLSRPLQAFNSFAALLLASLPLAIPAIPVHAQEAGVLKIAIMQAKEGEAEKYAPLQTYLHKKGVEVLLIGARDYAQAAQMFANGQVDGMFSGSGVAGTMLIKGVAQPLVRPISKKGWSTYWAVVVAEKGSPEFSGSVDYFNDKKVYAAKLASSGEFFWRATIAGETYWSSFWDQFFPEVRSFRYARSHGAAIKAVNEGRGDIAIVKNRVWDSVKHQYPNLVQVGKDTGENPNGTLIVSSKADSSVMNEVKRALLAIGSDTSPEAMSVKDRLGVKGYIATTESDFEHTIALLGTAGVDESFEWKFKDF